LIRGNALHQSNKNLSVSGERCQIIEQIKALRSQEQEQIVQFIKGMDGGASAGS